MSETPAEAARELREEMIEVLKLLNRAEEEHRDVDGYELDELRDLMARGRFPHATLADVERSLGVLLGNGFARELTTSEYAWERGRVIGPRYVISTEGKAFLVKQIGRVDRIG
ncbi:MAG TPA: hypothetical protein VMG99_07115 [Thermoplasmata archaeon]|nr:hypothetical protein [Thermoplasmata archaeon]